MKSFDRAGRDIELGIAINGPIDRVEKEVLISGTSDPVVGYDVTRAHDDESTTAHAEWQIVAHLHAFLHGDDTESVFWSHIWQTFEIGSTIVFGHLALAVADFTPSGLGGGYKGGDL